MSHAGRSAADEALAAELAAGRTVREAAAAAGVSDRTAFRRLEDGAFKARVSELRGEMVARAAGQLADGMAAAVAVLREGLGDEDPNLRHKSAVKLIELGVKVTELAELERRVQELEERHRQEHEKKGRR